MSPNVITINFALIGQKNARSLPRTYPNDAFGDLCQNQGGLQSLLKGLDDRANTHKEFPFKSCQESFKRIHSKA